jgi:hypothetical protein
MYAHRFIKLLAPLLFACIFPPAAMPAGAQMHDMKAASGKARPALALGAAVSPEGQLWVTGVDATGRLFVQSSTDFGASWGAPRRLDVGGDTIAADGDSRPSIAFGTGGIVVIAYTKPLAKPYTGDIRLLRSTDGGQTFAAPMTVHDDRQVITHRFQTLAFDRDGKLFVSWIDKRDAEAARAKEGASKAVYEGAAIYAKVSADGGKSFGPDLKLADSSCECCRIAMVDAPQTGMVALWRHVFAGSIRDHGFAALTALGHGQVPVRATEDGWVMAACPHHGPGLANATQGGFHAVWFGVKDQTAAVRYGRLDASGRPAGVARELPDPRAEHADVIADGKAVAVVWRSFDGERTRLRAWVSNDDGEHFETRELASSSVANDHPRLVAHRGNFYAVWRNENAIDVYKIAH